MVLHPLRLHRTIRATRLPRIAATAVGAIVAAAVACLAALPAPVAAESAIRVALLPDASAVAPGGSLSVEVRLSDCPDIDRFGPVTVRLDEARFEPLSIDRGPQVPYDLETSVEGGFLRISYADPTADHAGPIPQAGDILLCTLRFKVSDDAPEGMSTLALVGVEGFEDADGLALPAYAGTSGAISVKEEAKITPDPTATPAAEDTPTPAGPSPTPAPSTSPVPSEVPGPEDGTGAPSWLWTAWFATLAVALLELVLLLRRGAGGRRRPKVRRVR